MRTHVSHVRETLSKAAQLLALIPSWNDCGLSQSPLSPEDREAGEGIRRDTASVSLRYASSG